VSAPGVLTFLKRWWLLLILGPAAVGASGYLLASQLAPIYQANTAVLVTRGSVSGTPGVDDTVGAESLARTYAEALKTRPVLDDAAQQVGLVATQRELQQMVSIRQITGTQLLRVFVDDRDPVRAADMANAIVSVFSERNLEMQAGRYANSRLNLEQLVKTLQGELDNRSAELQSLRQSAAFGDPQLVRAENDFAQLQTTYSESVRAYENLRVAEARGLNGLTVVEPAIPPIEVSRPNKLQFTALGALAGLLLVIGVAKALEYLDDGLPDRERLAQSTGLRALGTIPRWRAPGAGVLANQATSRRPDREARRAAEAYRLLFGTLMIASTDEEEQLHAVLVTSAAMEEGKSQTAANLAGVLAEAGRRVILVDADVHRPTQMRRFILPNRAGLSTLLLNPNLGVESVLRETSTPGLRVLTAGPAPAAPSALFTSRRLAMRLAELRTHCDVLVIDSPPVLAQPDAALMGAHVDGVLFVVDARKSRGRQVRRAVDMLQEAGGTILGAALNRVSPHGMDYVQYQSYTPESEDPVEEGQAANSPLASGKAS
jgi:non-specific protein-tyrosine kinase